MSKVLSQNAHRRPHRRKCNHRPHPPPPRPVGERGAVQFRPGVSGRCRDHQPFSRRPLSRSTAWIRSWTTIFARAHEHARQGRCVQRGGFPYLMSTMPIRGDRSSTLTRPPALITTLAKKSHFISIFRDECPHRSKSDFLALSMHHNVDEKRG